MKITMIHEDGTEEERDMTTEEKRLFRDHRVSNTIDDRLARIESELVLRKQEHEANKAEIAKLKANPRTGSTS